MYIVTAGFKKLFLLTITIALTCFSPLMGKQLAAYADSTPCTAPADATYGSGVHHPVGSDAVAYSYNCSTGLWTSAYYTYNPTTGQVSPTYPPDYSYDCTSNTWSKVYYDYDPATGYYKTRVATTDPGLPTGCPVVTPAPASPALTTGAPTAPVTFGANSPTGTAVTNTGPSSSNTSSGTTTLSNASTNTAGVTLNNLIGVASTSGNTAVTGNTLGGSATSGDVLALANVANLLQSTSSVFGPNTTLFTANINGNVNGDFMFDPSAILASGPASTNVASGTLTVNTNNQNTTNAGIANTINVGASSGSATVASNTSGGNATSGTADAVVNLMNLINSTVAAGKSFIGTININGNLNGDILLPQNVLDQLLAASGPSSNNVANASLTNSLATANNTTATTQNNLNNVALTGNASTTGNTSAGSATSGAAHTGVTLLNLTGSNTVGKNDLLVFVNVLGRWVGMIMAAPAGTTAAELGGGISSSGPNSSNALATTLSNSLSTTNNANLGILNNVNVAATSGNATVADNTLGGNARSGNANTAVNILNLTGSNLSLSNWFGILFINVFGVWTGSFGINTSAGDPVTNPTLNPIQAANEQELSNTIHQFATFSPHTSLSKPTTNSGGTVLGDDDGNSGTGSGERNPLTSVLGATSAVAQKITPHLPVPQSGTHTDLLLSAIGTAIAVAMLAGERVTTLRRNRKA